MKKEIVIVGARGLGKELVGYLEEDENYRITCILDELEELSLFGYEIVHPQKYQGTCRNAVFAVGYPEHKETVLQKYDHLHFIWDTYIHPSAIVSRHARIGEGVVIGPFTVIAGNAAVGSFALVNAYAAVGHDSAIGRYSSLMPYACINGGVKIGEKCLLATGVKILPDVTVGDRCRASAGSIVTRDVPADSLIFGNPAQHKPDIAMLARARSIQKQGEQTDAHADS